ncbi:MAG: biopolymer transporter ExbD [Planctomycetota bacterium]|nr:MAG: biopolymer transporter ExbD [Planctomycetota bacterium]
MEDPRDQDCKLEMTPMIDVVFLLLIFFMCTLRFKTLEGKLAAYLPKDVGGNVTPSKLGEDVEIRLRVVREGRRLDVRGEPYAGAGRWIYDDTRELEYRVGPWKTTRLGDLERRLAELHALDVDRASKIDASDGIVYGDVARVLDAALGAGFRAIEFVGAPPSR